LGKDDYTISKTKMFGADHFVYVPKSNLDKRHFLDALD